jgi:hypothetical protein
MTPRCRALARAAQLAAETAATTSDTRHADEAERLWQMLKAEIDRVPGAPEKARRTDRTWRW